MSALDELREMKNERRRQRRKAVKKLEELKNNKIILISEPREKVGQGITSLTEYFYDTPDRERVEFLESHFTSCPDCQQFRAKYESTLELVDKRKKIETDKVFWSDFEARLEQNIREETRPDLASEEMPGFSRRLKRVLGYKRTHCCLYG